MKDIFETKIVCKQCNSEMQPAIVEKNGFKLRAVECRKCKERIVHPSDMEKFNQYNDLRRKTYNVKLRVIGNSHAISIPKEIVDFISETNQSFHTHMNEVVKLCFEDFGKLSLNFIDDNILEKRERIRR